MDDELAWLRGVVEAMTPGPWTNGEDRTEHGTSYWPMGADGAYLMAGNDAVQDGDDATAIAALRNVAPEMLAVITRAARNDDCENPRPTFVGWTSVPGRCGACRGCALHAALDALTAKLRALRGEEPNHA